ncbi:energy-coupling factor ABC transporter ATP-binding protein [Latilactobacillus curvatus]|uniref:energy-coupling factor ABC transporter ATP-binding protein n=1 Tax=Latilactobacillus curvatus TaxID=28038 RepID=UPI000FECD6C9|nr:ABC transporter ATP-binding protein [Latilactobacillus curvatus]QAR34633.1 ABC transporter ATP-binding protein [Latilactobacillus curvatus]
MTTVELRHVSFNYADTSNEILKDISLTFRSGQRIAIVGQNGAGKTTLIKQLNGLLVPSSGEILIDGISVSSKPTYEWAKQIGYVFQNPNDQLFLDSVKKEFLFGIKNLKFSNIEIQARLAKVAKLTGLTDYLNLHPLDLTDVQKKFCTIGSVVMMNPDIVILDEPTGGQDFLGKQRLSKLLLQLKQQNKICLAVSHDMKFVSRNFDRVIMMKQGSVVADGTPIEVFSDRLSLDEAAIVLPPIMNLEHQLGWQVDSTDINSFIAEFRRKKREKI